MEISKFRLAKNLCPLLIGGVVMMTYANTALAEDSLSDGKLTVGMEIAYPPFESYDGDKVVGFDPELAELLAQKMNVGTEFSDSKFTNLILGLASNKFDAVISGMYVLPERLEKAYAIPYAKTGAHILTLKDAKIKPETENQLCGLKVGLQQGTSWAKQLETLSEDFCVKQGKGTITVQEFPTAPEVSQALMSRNIDAQVEIAGAAKMFTERSRGRIEISSPEIIYPQTLGMFVNKSNDALRDKLINAMSAIKADGSYLALIEKYELTPVSN